MHAGMLSGYLLQEYCPDAHACDARTGEEMGELGRCDGRRMWGNYWNPDAHIAAAHSNPAGEAHIPGLLEVAACGQKLS